MLYHIFNVYPYYVINLALYLFAFEFILLIVMKCHIIWWWYIHILVYNFFSRRWLNVYNFVFQTGGWLVPRPFLRYFTVWISKGCPDQGKGGGQPWARTFIWLWVTKELNSIIACNIGWSNLNNTGDD